MEEEKRAILKQRIKPLDIDEADAAKLAEKAKELLNLITRLEGERYDLEKYFKAKQIDVRHTHNHTYTHSVSISYTRFFCF